MKINKAKSSPKIILSPVVEEKLAQKKVSASEREAFCRQLAKIEREFSRDQIIHQNKYTKAVKTGLLNTAQAKDFIVQFLIFSLNFVSVECKRMVWAAGTPSERASRIILASELGVRMNPETHDVEGEIFHHADAHVEWLRDMGESIGIPREILGRWDTGTPATHAFISGLYKSYASPNSSRGAGGSFKIETWAGAYLDKPGEEQNNFWVELRDAFHIYNLRYRVSQGEPPLPLGFFEEHIKLELGHVATVGDELVEIFFSPHFDLKQWWLGFRQAQKALSVFWHGLYNTWKRLGATRVL